LARYEHLPIFKKAMELSVYTEETVRKFSRYQKYGIGEDLRDLSRQIVLLIIRANSTEQKSPVLQELVETCEQLKVMLVLAKEVKAFQSFTSFQQAAGLATSLCRQSEGWGGRA
jgi:hypothetical protein